MTEADEAEVWRWPRFSPPGLLVGPLPHKRTPSGDWVPDYSYPGVANRIALEVEFVIITNHIKGRYQ